MRVTGTHLRCVGCTKPIQAKAIPRPRERRNGIASVLYPRPGAPIPGDGTPSQPHTFRDYSTARTYEDGMSYGGTQSGIVFAIGRYFRHFRLDLLQCGSTPSDYGRGESVQSDFQ